MLDQKYPVFGMIQSSTGKGCFAEYVRIDAEKDKMMLKPDCVSFEEAGGATVAGIAAYTSVFDHGNVNNQKSVCVIGAVGAIGSFATQFAKSAGSTVIAICAKDDV
jgi:NADPH:quinone reductase-like Zn-dependent oxidoreductase